MFVTNYKQLYQIKASRSIENACGFGELQPNAFILENCFRMFRGDRSSKWAELTA